MGIFPKEYLIPIENNDDLKVCVEVGIDEFKEKYWVECVVLSVENRKIFRVIGKKFNLPDEEFAYSEGLRMYRAFLRAE